jgi:hypothetical protein
MRPGTRQKMALRPLALGAQDDTSKSKVKNQNNKKRRRPCDALPF